MIFGKPSLTARIAIGKLVGFAIGLIGFVSMPAFWPEADPLIRWGILLWYPTMGAFIGVSGVFTHHPVLHLPMPWWFQAPLIGAWMNFVLTFFAYDAMAAALVAMFGVTNAFTSPFWFMLEGGIVGLIIGYSATRFGGEGKELFEGHGGAST
ncbi:MAG: hypothetical protein OXC14_03260 [Rhodospirillaceae bacterium]|nr:hypothetical protein [Rhodospirillaceae bacterium]